MKKILIIKCGEAFPKIKEQFGDFDEMIMETAGVSKKNVIVSSVYQDINSLPSLQEIGAIIITGSHAMVTNYEEWSVNLAAWLRDIQKEKIPTLGICYGHQILADALGGKVAPHPNGIEIGTTTIELTDAGKTDPLFHNLPTTFLGHATHYQSVITLPEQATLLAHNDFEHHHAFAIDDHIWGVQFHPEFSADYTHAYIDMQAEQLQKDGFDMKLLHGTVKEHEYGRELLKQFLMLAGFKEICLYPNK